MSDTIKDFFILYSHVHINCNQREALIINIETNSFFYTKNTKFIIAFKSLSLPTIHYMLPVTEDMKNDNDLITFLKLLETEFCGEFIKTSLHNRPVQFSPIFKIAGNTPLQTLPEFHKKNGDVSLIKNFENELGSNILSNVLELSIYYNTLIKEVSNPYFPIHKQYPYPIVDKEYSCLNDISLIFEYIFPRLRAINLIVGNLTEFDITTIKNIIEKYKLHNMISLYMVSSEFQYVNSAFIDLFSMVYVWNNTSSEIIKASEGVTNFLLIENEEEMSLFENNPNIDEIYPLYNGKNNSFYDDYLLFDTKDLMIDRDLTDREIFMNQYINSNFFGEVAIYPNGDVYSCKTRPCIGNIHNNNIKSIVFKELNNYQHWHLTRNAMPHCKDCVYNWICPPVTLNELEINKWNFCKTT